MGRERTTVAVTRQILRIRGDPFLTNSPMARARSPMGRSTAQHSITPSPANADESPHGGGKAVAHTMNPPQATAGTAKTKATIWKSTPMPVDFFPTGGAPAGSWPLTFSMCSIPSFAAIRAFRIVPVFWCQRSTIIRLGRHQALPRNVWVPAGFDHSCLVAAHIFLPKISASRCSRALHGN